MTVCDVGIWGGKNSNVTVIRLRTYYSILFPNSNLSDVAISFRLAGNWFWFTLIPIPIITAGIFLEWYSHKIPATFLPFSKRSLGHFSNAGWAINSFTAKTVASPAINVRNGNCSGVILGRMKVER